MPLYPTKYATDGMVNPKMVAFYRARAKGGAALIVLDCPCLDYPRAYTATHKLRIDTDEYVHGLKGLLNAVKSEGQSADSRRQAKRGYVDRTSGEHNVH